MIQGLKVYYKSFYLAGIGICIINQVLRKAKKHLGDELNNLPESKFEQGQTITNGEKVITIDFVEYDFDREEYYYYPIKYRMSQTIYESDGKLTDPPNPHSLETYDMLFGENSQRSNVLTH